jgi:ferredoxin
MPILQVIDAAGDDHLIDAQDGEPLMRALRDAGLVEAICGGALSCGTCVVAFDDAATAALLPQADAMEAALLEGLNHAPPAQRLSCQIGVFPEMDGSRLRLP